MFLSLIFTQCIPCCVFFFLPGTAIVPPLQSLETTVTLQSLETTVTKPSLPTASPSPCTIEAFLVPLVIAAAIALCSLLPSVALAITVIVVYRIKVSRLECIIFASTSKLPGTSKLYKSHSKCKLQTENNIIIEEDGLEEDGVQLKHSAQDMSWSHASVHGSTGIEVLKGTSYSSVVPSMISEDHATAPKIKNLPNIVIRNAGSLGPSNKVILSTLAKSRPNVNLLMK